VLGRPEHDRIALGCARGARDPEQAQVQRLGSARSELDAPRVDRQCARNLATALGQGLRGAHSGRVARRGVRELLLEKRRHRSPHARVERSRRGVVQVDVGHGLNAPEYGQGPMARRGAGGGFFLPSGTSALSLVHQPQSQSAAPFGARPDSTPSRTRPRTGGTHELLALALTSVVTKVARAQALVEFGVGQPRYRSNLRAEYR